MQRALLTVLLGSTLGVCVLNAQLDDAAFCAQYSNAPLPAEAKVAAPTQPPDCASYKSYRGIGRPVDPNAARQCAWQERAAQQAGLGQNAKEPTAWVVGGSLILADLYFNGAGVEKNEPLALRFACEAEPGMANLAHEDIAAGKAKRPIEFCDFAATTFTMNFCTSAQAETRTAAQSRTESSFAATLTPAQRAAFDALLRARNRYVEQHAGEVYQGGTIRIVRTITSEQILEDQFTTRLNRLKRGQPPAATGTSRQAADAELQKTYDAKMAALRAQPKAEISSEQITAEQVRDAQRAWIAYRDAWMNFVQLYSPAAADAMFVSLNHERTALLKSIDAQQ